MTSKSSPAEKQDPSAVIAAQLREWGDRNPHYIAGDIIRALRAAGWAIVPLSGISSGEALAYRSGMTTSSERKK